MTGRTGGPTGVGTGRRILIVAAQRPGVGEEVSWMRETTLQDARDGFTAHAAMYVLVMAALIVLNFFLTGFCWFVIPLVGWGSILALHYLHLRRVGKADATRPAQTRQQATTTGRVA
jgi:hypothetical protein